MLATLFLFGLRQLVEPIALVFLLTTTTTTAAFTYSRSSRAIQPLAASSLVNTEWNFRLDVGQQPGTWMPKRYPGWGESGARLGIGGLRVRFGSAPASHMMNDGEDTEPLVAADGADAVRVVEVISEPCVFVSSKGQETVEFTGGGWSIQKRQNSIGDIRNANGDTVAPDGLLRFWLDCPTGARRQDVSIEPGTRIIFSTGVWEDPVAVSGGEQEYEQTMQELEELIQKTRENKEKQANQSLWQQFGTFRTMVSDSRQYDALKEKCLRLGRQLPPLNSPTAKNGCIMAPNGSLVIPGKRLTDWMPPSEYLILGTFSISAPER